MSEKIKKEYTENIWTNNDGKIDGYTFKGKRQFSKALLGLKSIMIKGQANEIDNVKFTALDTRIQGVGLEIDVQIINNRKSGIAVLKIYGPKEDIRKENTVTVSKSKESDSKFIVLLAEKVVVPLMDRFLSGEMEILASKSNSSAGLGYEAKKFRCSFCEKICKSAGGLKNHTTQMHLEVQNGDEKQQNSGKEHNKRKATEDVVDVVESLLAEVVNKDKKERMSEEILEDDRNVKKYTKMCNTCDFKVETERKYISMQKILEHRDLCSFRINCLQCEKTFKDQMMLKRHMRNEHSITTSSISPPMKKKKVDFKTNTNPDYSVEEMDIDNSDCHEEVLKQRSDMMDKKAIEKQKRIDEEVEDFLKKKAEKKEKEDELIKEKKRQQLKSKRQKNKSNKKQNHYMVPNIKDIPENCEDLFNDDVVYEVPGDGACGPNSAAAHLFEDEVFGPKLRKNMNLFWANHFYRKYQYITPCSSETPFKRNIKGELIEFSYPELLIEFLRTSDDAQYMWSDSEELAILADMYQMRIKIITTNRKNPTINWIYPDKNLAEYAELKDVEISDMILLHQEENHFDLVVSRNSNLATKGSLSYRHNIGPTMVVDNEGEDDKDAKNTGDDEKEIDNTKI